MVSLYLGAQESKPLLGVRLKTFRNAGNKVFIFLRTTAWLRTMLLWSRILQVGWLNARTLWMVLTSTVAKAVTRGFVYNQFFLHLYIWHLGWDGHRWALGRMTDRNQYAKFKCRWNRKRDPGDDSRGVIQFQKLFRMERTLKGNLG